MKKTCVVLILLLASYVSKAYENVPAMVYVNAKKQHDTVGFNLVKELSAFFYAKILTGQANLYDSPKKQTRISASALQTLEKTSNTRFTETEDLFINEYWSSNKNTTSFRVAGFSFTSKNSSGASISYGYIEAEEVKSLMQDNYIPVNANGSFFTSYWDALMSLRYDYNLVQFGSQTFAKKPQEAIDIKADAFFNNKRVENQVILTGAKHLVYEVERDMVNEKSVANSMLNGLEQFLNNNPEEYLNLGGNAYHSHLKKLPKLKVNKVVVTENGVRPNGSKPQYYPKFVVIYVDGKALQPVTMDELAAYKLFFSFQCMEDICRDKKFEYLITDINNQQIDAGESDLYKKALRNYYWGQLTEYVKSLKLN